MIKKQVLKYRKVSISLGILEHSNDFLSLEFVLTFISNQSSHTNVCFESHFIWKEHLPHNSVIARLNSREFYTSVNINTMQMMIYWFSFIYDLLFIASCRANVKCSLCSSNTGRGCRILGLVNPLFWKMRRQVFYVFLQFVLW